MVFSSITFLYYFLPIVLAVYFLVPSRGGRTAVHNALLLAASLFFYAWGEPVYVALLAAVSFGGWVCGLFIERYRGTPASKRALVCSIVIGIGALGLFKYTDFFIVNINQLFHSGIGLFEFVMPIGLSFYTFQVLSYTIDLYRGNAHVQRNFLSFFTYVALFPQLVAGPIVRYVTVEKALSARKPTFADFAYGVRRFSIGLGKKVLIADTMGQLAVYCANDPEKNALSAWLYVAAFVFQIYFDFSGYSDMAIGLGRMFGFHFSENFRYPYASQSVTDFWRRWHISLSSWFRDYVYIPLGGNRVNASRHIFNILFVWFLTGFWHGAGWNFIAWGLYFGLLLLAEKYLLRRALAKAPQAVRHIYLMMIVVIGWTLFNADSLSGAGSNIAALFGFGVTSAASAQALYYLRSFGPLMAIAAVGSTEWPARWAARLLGMQEAGAAPEGAGAGAASVSDGKSSGGRATVPSGAAGSPEKKATAPEIVVMVPLRATRLAFLEPVFICVLLILSTAYIADGTFNPFIYFRF